MKKSILASSIFITAIVALSSTMASAQFSVQGGIGYNLGIPGDYIGQNENAGSRTAIYGSYGAGLNINAQITDNLSCCPMIEWGLGVDFQLGVKHSFTDNFTQGGENVAETDEGKINMLSFTPRIGMHVDCGHKFTPYSYYGPIIGIPMKLNETFTETSTSGGSSDVFVEGSNTTGKLSLGITGAIGARMAATKKLGVYFEVGYNYLNFYPNVRTVSSYELNGVSQLSSLSKSELETDYVKTLSSTDNTSSTQPSKAIVQPAPYGGFRINAGVRYSL